MDCGPRLTAAARRYLVTLSAAPALLGSTITRTMPADESCRPVGGGEELELTALQLIGLQP
jgi:hypothetical protein